MDVDKAPINRAHQLERKAQSLNRHKKYDQAIEAHKEAAELFKACMALGNNQIMFESMQLQREWNERQIRLLELKKAYMERVEKEKKMNGMTPSKTPQKEAENLEAKIFLAMETHDSLIYYLSNKGVATNDKQTYSTIEEGDEGSVQLVGNKHPKDEATVIEELKVLSGQLRESVHGLLIQLDDRNKEIESLRAHIKHLELVRSSKSENENSSLISSTESSGGASPKSNPPAELDIPSLSGLPQLELLQVPLYDMSNLRQFSVSEVSTKLLRRE
ncbi:hypothetical protein GWI33_010756 [Rhynchophorus ferrugineus]|uniref:Nuclear receptor-binding factor 2 MIT domain-containing protein n=1 Tax=Rhynchophorus ferrugineus TaxID=354439 RepID=A0A834IWV9_RHYFE|nr:hypothetical protein GWI33_010756 [Rhynchophorus ferrugineus]